MSDHRSRAALLSRVALCAVTAFTLAACGGESGSGSDPTAPITDPTPAPDTPVTPTNTAPVIDGSPSLTAKAGTAYSFVPTASDADHDALTFSITGMPAWAAFDASTGQLSGTPADANVGQSGDIEITVSDSKAQDSIGPFRIQVAARDATPTPSNSAPTITGSPSTMVIAGSAYIFIPTATDADADALTFSISNRPQWSTFSTSTGQLSGTPTAANVGTVSNIRISVSDGKATTSLAAFSIQVQAPPNGAPTISGTPATSVQAGTAYSFKPTASDAENDTLTYSIQNKPAWASFSTTTGLLSGTPAAANVGAFANIRISVSDSKLSAALAAFTITVTAAANKPPTISGTPAIAAVVGSPYSFTPTAADADKDTLTFSIQNKPSWATFSTSSGQLTGTPAAAGTFANIVISVSDGKVSTALAAFTITVTAAANKAPTISGTPATSVTAGSAYGFTPTASDADTGDTLTFSIANKPSWATFSTSTGQLSGTPATANAGTTSNIVISVTDGKATVSLAAFAITVTSPTATGSASLSWTPPTQNSDGTALTNLAGYHVYYGTSASNLDQTVQITNPGVASYVIENLTSGTWYFTVKAYTSTGVESGDSNIASKTIP